MPVAQHPLASPTVVGNTITVDMMLQNPTRVTALLADLTLQKFLINYIFDSAGGVEGGAVIYDQPTVNELYPERDVQQVAVGAEFPIITADRRAPKVALVEKWGGKVWIPDEAVARNQSGVYMRELRKLANAMVRKLNTRAIAILEAAIAANGGASNMTGSDWSAVNMVGTSPTNPSATPFADFMRAQLAADTMELGITFDTVLVNPTQRYEMAVAYEGAGIALQPLLDSAGMRMVWSNRVPLGTAYVIASGQLGELRVEKPLGTETWREPKTERNWTQTSWRGVMYVTNPFAVMKMTGL
jgi:hypothetical protein